MTLEGDQGKAQWQRGTWYYNRPVHIPWSLQQAHCLQDSFCNNSSRKWEGSVSHAEIHPLKKKKRKKRSWPFQLVQMHTVLKFCLCLTRQNTGTARKYGQGVGQTCSVSLEGGVWECRGAWRRAINSERKLGFMWNLYQPCWVHFNSFYFTLCLDLACREQQSRNSADSESGCQTFCRKQKDERDCLLRGQAGRSEGLIPLQAEEIIRISWVIKIRMESSLKIFFRSVHFPLISRVSCQASTGSATGGMCSQTSSFSPSLR